METPERAADFVPAGLAALGIEADELELQLIAGVHQVFWGPISELIAFEAGAVEPERAPDYSGPPA